MHGESITATGKFGQIPDYLPRRYYLVGTSDFAAESETFMRTTPYISRSDSLVPYAQAFVFAQLEYSISSWQVIISSHKFVILMGTGTL